MSEPTTRPGELGRIAHDEIRFRVEVLTGIAELKTMLVAHQNEDERRFDDIEDRLNGAVINIGSVNNARNWALGAKSMLGWIIAGIMALATLGISAYAAFK